MRPPRSARPVALLAAIVPIAAGTLGAQQVTTTSQRATGSYRLNNGATTSLVSTFPPNDPVDVLAFPSDNTGGVASSAGLHSYGSTFGNFGSRSSGAGVYDVTGSYRIAQTVTNNTGASGNALFNFFITPGLLSNDIQSILGAGQSVSAGITFDVRVSRGGGPATRAFYSSATLTTVGGVASPVFVLDPTGTDLFTRQADNPFYYAIAGGAQQADLGVLGAGESLELTYEISTFARGNAPGGEEYTIPERRFETPEQFVQFCQSNNNGETGPSCICDFDNTPTLSAARAEGEVEPQLIPGGRNCRIPEGEYVIPARTVRGRPSGSHTSSGDPFTFDVNSGGTPQFQTNNAANVFGAPTVTLSSVPEPGTVALTLSGLGVLAAAGWRRRRNG